MIKRLSKNHTIILSSHILSEVSAVCDKIMIINKGKLIVSDTPENLSSHMEGANKVHLLVKGTKDKVAKALKKVEGIDKVDYQNVAEADLLDVDIQTKEAIDIREELFYAMVEAGCPIYGLERNVMSLEDIFLELTDNNIKTEKKKKNIFGQMRKQKQEEVQEEVQEEQVEEDQIKEDQIEEEQVQVKQKQDEIKVENNEIKSEKEEEEC